jgi:hypothetical protein
VTDFYKAIQAKAAETVIFSWIEYPDKATRDTANEKMAAESDTDMEMPVGDKRMVGWAPLAGAISTANSRPEYRYSSPASEINSSGGRSPSRLNCSP